MKGAWDNTVEYWLRSLQARSAECPVVIVGTNLDVVREKKVIYQFEMSFLYNLI